MRKFLSMFVDNRYKLTIPILVKVKARHEASKRRRFHFGTARYWFKRWPAATIIILQIK